MIFENYELEQFVKCKLNKSTIDLEDLNKIEKIIIRAKTITGKEINNSLNDLKKFTNLKEVYIHDFIIDENNAKIINNLKRIELLELHNCEVYNNILLKVNSLKLDRMKNIDRIKIKNVKKIELSNMPLFNFDYNNLSNIETINLNNLEGFKEIKIDAFRDCINLNIKNMSLLNLNSLVKLKKLRKINVINCKIDNLECFNKLTNIDKKISKEYLLDSKKGDFVEN